MELDVFQIFTDKVSLVIAYSSQHFCVPTMFFTFELLSLVELDKDHLSC